MLWWLGKKETPSGWELHRLFQGFIPSDPSESTLRETFSDEEFVRERRELIGGRMMHSLSDAYIWFRGWIARERGRGNDNLVRGALLVVSLGFLGLGCGMNPGEPEVGSDAWTQAVAIPSAMAELEENLGMGIPIEMNDRVEYWMRRFTTDQRLIFQDLLAREGRYATMIRSKLKAKGMPVELVYLAMIESGFSDDATSRVSAAGMWQFMGPTAVAYGLRIDEYVDERRDPIRATDAAVDYLFRLHEIYGSWHLAAAAYNAGPTRVSRALRRHAEEKTGDEALYWDIIEHLPRETRHYVPKLLAASYLARHSADSFDFEAVSPYAFEIVWVPGGTRLSQVATTLGVDPEVMRELNPHLIRGMTPPGSMYGLRVLPGGTDAVVAGLVLPGRGSRLADD